MKDPAQPKKLTRRDFVKTTAAGIGAATAAGMGVGAAGAAAQVTTQVAVPRRWDREADVVVIGAGATGLPAAIQAVQDGASVVLIDANDDVGGHAILSGGNVNLGGGTSAQKKYGINDSPDILFSDLTDWSVVEPNGFPDYRYNDREIIRAFADHAAETYEWLVAQGVVFVDKAPDRGGGHAVGNSAPRANHAAPMTWPQVETGVPVPPEIAATDSSGIGFIRPLEATARKLGVQILLQHRMAGLVRENPTSGRVLGIAVTNQNRTLHFRARKGVIIGTGGHTSNVNFRRIFDPRLTEEYQVAGEPYSFQDASGELAAMAVGASLWGAYNQTGEFGQAITKAGYIGCRYGYTNLTWGPKSKYFSKAGASGLRVADYQDVILVNQMGLRFYDETQGQFTDNNYNSINPYTPYSHLNAANIRWNPRNFLNAAMAGNRDGSNGGGPIWAIFDADAVQREKWTVTPPWVDIFQGYFASGQTFAELAANIKNKYQKKPMPAAALEQTVNRYNSFVDGGKDLDFGKATPKYKIEKPPFYAAWATPVLHDTRSGLRINAKCEVVDLDGKVIPGLYCGGESAGGFSLHGLARCCVQGRIAGHEAARASLASSATARG